MSSAGFLNGAAASVLARCATSLKPKAKAVFCGRANNSTNAHIAGDIRRRLKNGRYIGGVELAGAARMGMLVPSLTQQETVFRLNCFSRTSETAVNAAIE